MVITYYGGEFVKISSGEKTLAINPISKRSKLKSASFGSDMVLVTLMHSDMDGVEQVTRGDRVPFAIYGPGEYEVQNVFVKGVASISGYGLPAGKAGGEEGINTVYLITLDGMHLCFLGALKSKILSPALKEVIENVDILFVPIGGEGVLTPSDAHELAVLLEPKIVIPIHYGEIGKKNALSTFLKEEGSEKVKSIDKLTVKRKDIETKQGEVVVLAQ